MKVKWTELTKEIDNKKVWNDDLYKEKDGKRIQLTNFKDAKWRVIYKDGSVVDDDGKGNYAKLKRSGVKSIGIVDGSGTVLHTVQVVNDKFLICLRNTVRGNRDNVGFDNPKRCFILATEGKQDFVWDDGDIDELDQFGDQEPYTKPKGGVFDLW